MDDIFSPNASSTTIQYIPARLGARMAQGLDINCDLDPEAIGYSSELIRADKESRQAKQLRLAYEERIVLEKKYAAEQARRVG